MFKIMLYLGGIFLISVGIFLTVLYLNLLIMGYTFLDFVKFISKGPVVWLIFLGNLCLYIALKKKKES